jgi:hypothetical protein
MPHRNMIEPACVPLTRKFDGARSYVHHPFQIFVGETRFFFFPRSTCGPNNAEAERVVKMHGMCIRFAEKKREFSFPILFGSVGSFLLLATTVISKAHLLLSLLLLLLLFLLLLLLLLSRVFLFTLHTLCNAIPLYHQMHACMRFVSGAVCMHWVDPERERVKGHGQKYIRNVQKLLLTIRILERFNISFFLGVGSWCCCIIAVWNTDTL